MCPRKRLVQSKIRRSKARRHGRVRVQASPWLVAMASPPKQWEWLWPLPPLLRLTRRTRPLLRLGVALSFGCVQEEGQLRTVRNIKGDQVDCFWTDVNGQINADSFPVDVLQMF
jgi:hypothetical protein